MSKKYIIGLGTGRCGTVSLSHLLNQQKDSTFTHECTPRLPWERNMGQFKKLTQSLQNRNSDVVGDVSFYHLPYIEQFLEWDDQVKFVCLQRPMEPTVESYLKKVNSRNHWQTSGTPDVWDKHYPTYENYLTKKEAIETYWDEYYTTANGYAWAYPKSFRLVLTEDLNNGEKVEELLEFCGFGEPNVVTNIVRNKGK